MLLLFKPIVRSMEQSIGANSEDGKLLEFRQQLEQPA